MLKYFWAVILPPAVAWRYGGFGKFLFNSLLSLFFWAPGIIHAAMVAAEYDRKKRREDEERRHRETLSVMMNRGGRNE